MACMCNVAINNNVAQGELTGPVRDLGVAGSNVVSPSCPTEDALFQSDMNESLLSLKRSETTPQHEKSPAMPRQTNGPMNSQNFIRSVFGV